MTLIWVVNYKLITLKIGIHQVAFEDQWVPSMIDTPEYNNDAEFFEERGYIFLCMFI